MGDRRLIATIVAAVFGLGAVLTWLPSLGADREVLVATPGAAPIGVTATLPLARGRDVCVDAVSLEPAVTAIRIRLAETNGQPRPRITVTVRDGRGRRLARGTAPAGPGVGGDIDIPVKGQIPSELGSVCVSAANPREIELAGSNEFRTKSRSTTRVAGQALDADLSLTLLGRPRSIASRAGEVLRHAATFKPVPAWLIALLGILVTIAVPVGLVAALRSALDPRRD